MAGEPRPSSPRPAGGSSPGAGAALTCLRLAPALTASFPAFPAARLAGGLGRLRGALPVPKEGRLALRRRESR